MTPTPKVSYTYAISLVVSPSDGPELLAKSLKSLEIQSVYPDEIVLLKNGLLSPIQEIIIEDFFRTIAILALFGILYLIGQGILNLIWKPIDRMEEKKKQKKVALSDNLSKDNSKVPQSKKRKKVAKKTTNTKNKNLK